MQLTPRLARASLPLLLAFLPALSNCHPTAPQLSPVDAPADAAPGVRIPVVEIDPPPAPAPPVRLTASDGTGLRLIELRARAVVDEPLAFTELRLVFENPLDRTLEGNFSMTLPQGAALSRFAMKIDERWQEGEVVERQRAREAYEDFLHRRQDPALLEQAAGNEFTARVFPIPPKGKKELILSYSQEITPAAPYVVPLRGLPAVGLVDVEVTLAGGKTPVQKMQSTRAAPDADFTLDPKHLKGGFGLRNGNLVLARVRPFADAAPDPIGSAILLVDTSASRALGFGEQVRLVERVVRTIVASTGADTPLVVGCYDQTADLIFEGKAGAFSQNELGRIRQRQAFGASNLELALGWAAARAKAGGAKRVVLVSDGVATAGEVRPDKLKAASLRLKDAGVERLDAIAAGGIRDDALLRQMVTAGLPHDGVVVGATADSATLRRRLTQATRSGIGVKIDGARFVWPEKLDGVQPGDEVLVYADVPVEKPVTIAVGGREPVAPELRWVERPLLGRAWAQAKIASLLARQAREGQAEETEKEIVALSTAHRVLSPYTGLLVLETEQDYQRFHIDHRSLSDILAVQGGRIAVMKRSSPFAGKPPVAVRAPEPSAPAELPERASITPPARRTPSTSAPAPQDPQDAKGNMWGEEIGDAFGAGGLGLSGVGEGGGGRGESIGLGSVGTVGHGAGSGSSAGSARAPAPRASVTRSAPRPVRPAPPQLRMGATAVSGRVPPEIIQRSVRQRFGRFRGCYERGLLANPRLQGRVTVRFVIDSTGTVTSAVDAGSDLPSPAVVSCVVREFLDLKFTAPENGHITVVYPIQFSPADGASQPPPSPLATPARTAPQIPEAAPEPPRAEPYVGPFKTVMDDISQGLLKHALDVAWKWHRQSPGDVMALVALGEVFEAAGNPANAARSYGSIVDLFPSRADLRRFAGERLERIRAGTGLDLALDTYAKAAEQRPDHPSSHRLLAFARLKKGDFDGAFEAIWTALQTPYPPNRFLGVDRILREDLGLIAAAWIKAEPARKDEILTRVKDARGIIEDTPSLRFVLNWETDANDVDFHIYDADGAHAYYSQPSLPGGGELYADVTTGYGPECFTIRQPKDRRSPSYTLQAHYYSRGPMGYGMGKVQIIDHDGKGGLSFDERSFVAMVDQAFVDLGKVTR